MINKKKLLAIFIVICLVVTVFAGCKGDAGKGSSTASNEGFDVNIGDGNNGVSGGSTASGNTTSGSGAGTVQNNPIKKGDTVVNNKDSDKFPGRAKNLNGRTITIKYWNAYLLGGNSSETSKRAQILNENIENTLNCKLKFVDTNFETIRTSIASGSPAVDIWWIQTVGEFFDAYKAGLVQPLDPLKVIDFSDRTRFTIGSDIPVIDNVHYGIAPMAYGLVRRVYDNMLFVNFTALAKANYTPEQLYTMQNNGTWTWDAFEKVCADVSKVTGIYPVTEYVNSFNTNMFTYQMLMNSNGTDWINRNNTTVTFNGGSDAGKFVLGKYAEWRTKGYIVKKNFWESRTDFLNGKVAFMPSTLDYLAAEATDQLVKLNYGIMYPPKGPNVKEYKVSASDYSFTCIPKGIKNPNEVATVMDLINTRLFSEAEEKANTDIEAVKYSTVKGSIDTLKSLWAKGSPEITWSCLGNGAGISSVPGAKTGWYDLVNQVGEGTKTPQQAIDAAANFNNLLANTMKKR